MSPELREYAAQARSSEVPGRMHCQAREQHFVIDGPPWNGFPGEALMPGEAFLAGIASCGVELIQMFAADDGTEHGRIDVALRGTIDRENPLRDDVTVFNTVHMSVEIAGVSEDVARDLTERFQRRCPLYGSVAACGSEIEVEVRTG
ncbi:MAG: OsmC family protein [Solirubrobacterales bacterium]